MPCVDHPTARHAAALLCLLCLSLAPGAFANDDPFAATRNEFMRAYARVAQPTGAPADSEALRLYPLYPWLQAARIRQSLQSGAASFDSLDERAATFLSYYDDEPVARGLRRVWLDSLAERRRWPLFLEHYRESVAGDALRCHELTARIETGRTEQLEKDIAEQWLTPQSLRECEQPFDWLRAQGKLSDALIEQRVRLTLADGSTRFARQIIAQLPPGKAAPYVQWAGMLDDPQRGIDALIAAPRTPVEPEALLATWTKLVRRDRDAALARFDALKRARKLDAREASPFALALAAPLAWNRDPAALHYFAKVEASDFDEIGHEWHVRAALWAHDWKRVAEAIAAMPEEQRQQARWLYWAGRAAQARDDRTMSTQLYESVLPFDNYYSAMAAARLERPARPHPEMVVADKVLLEQLAQLPAFVRSRELLRAKLRGEAHSEWQYGLASLPADKRPQLIHLASDWGWYDQSVATATQLRVFYDYELLYPRPYDREVRAAARLTDVEPDLIYGLMRQESLYRPDAVSSANAYGLLQLIPSTARSTAQHWKRPRPSTSDLLDPSVSVTLGAGQIRMLLDRFDGQTAVALAGYNAGPNAAKRWLPEEAIDPDIWIENIPYNETRNYVQRVLWHTIVFAWLRSGDGQRTEAWLARIGPPDDPTRVGTL